MQGGRSAVASMVLVAAMVAGCGAKDASSTDVPTVPTVATIAVTTTATPAAAVTTAAATTSAPSAAAPTTMPPTTVVPTSAPADTAAPSSVPADFRSAAAQACADANQLAYTDAERIGYWSKELNPAEQAEYFAGRAAQVDWLVAELSALTPDARFAERWPTLLGNLDDYSAWARENVRTITATGARVQEMSPDSLQSFRAAFDLGFGNACQDLFDMN